MAFGQSELCSKTLRAIPATELFGEGNAGPLLHHIYIWPTTLWYHPLTVGAGPRTRLVMKTALKALARRSLSAFMGARELNSFVYKTYLRARVKWPDIPVKPVELYGQFGEDLIVLSLLEAKALTDRLDLKKERYLEIGGNHPFGTSATFLLKKHLEMIGVIVEAYSELVPVV